MIDGDTFMSFNPGTNLIVIRNISFVNIKDNSLSALLLYAIVYMILPGARLASIPIGLISFEYSPVSINFPSVLSAKIFIIDNKNRRYIIKDNRKRN